MSELREAWLIRHGPIAVEPGRLIGWTDESVADPAAEAPRAARYARRIGTAGAVFSSDLTRAIQTARPIADALGRSLLETPDLREMHFGEWEGRTWKEIEDESPEAYREYMAHWQTARTPGGESLRDLVARVTAFVDTDFATARCERVVVVAHGGSLRILAALLLDLPVATAMTLALDRGGAIRVDLREKTTSCYGPPGDESSWRAG